MLLVSPFPFFFSFFLSSFALSGGVSSPAYRSPTVCWLARVQCLGKYGEASFWLGLFTAPGTT